MASSSQESGPLTDLAQQASRKGGEVAQWLQDSEPADVLEAVRFPTPGAARCTFLALCGSAGIVAGRLTRSTVANRDQPGQARDTGGVTGSKVGPPAAPTPPGRRPTRPATRRTGPSTGVYGGSVESTAPADPAAVPDRDGRCRVRGYGVGPRTAVFR